MSTCDATSSAYNIWTWNAETRLLRNEKTGGCLSAVGGPTAVYMKIICTPAEEEQWWDYDPNTKLLRSVKRGLCLNAENIAELGAGTNLAACDESSNNQQWMLTDTWPASEAMPTMSYTICSVTEAVGPENIHLTPLDGNAACDISDKENWISAENPALHFTNPDLAGVEVFDETELAFEPVQSPKPGIAGTIVVTTMVAARCNGSQVAGKTFFGLEKTDGNGVQEIDFYQYDRRLRWVDNTLENPAYVIAGADSGGRHGICPAVPRSFLNEDTCVRRPRGACAAPVFSPRMMTLDQDTLRKWYSDSDKYVYAVTGLRLEAGTAEWVPPCTAHHVSRWVQTSSSGNCTSTGPALPRNHRISWGFGHATAGGGSSITINVGDSVTWVWDLDYDQHNVVSGTRGTEETPETLTYVFDSGYRTRARHGHNPEFTHLFDQEGAFPYFCSPHPGMDAVINVTTGGIVDEPAVILSGDTANVVRAAITAYDEEPIAGASTLYSSARAAAAYNPTTVDSDGNQVCNTWLGSYAEAERRCNEDPTCRHLYDYDGGGRAWQLCSSVVFDVNGAATVRTKPVRFWGGADGGANPSIRDVVVADSITAENGWQCSMDATTTIGSKIVVDGACWQHSHPDEGSVFDMSRWTFMHPGTRNTERAGRRNHITKWAERGEAAIRFPIGHPLSRWRDAKKWPRHMQHVGKLGDMVDFATLPVNLRTDKMAEAIGAVRDFPDKGTEVCGSRGEVANDPAMSHRYTSTYVATPDTALDQRSSQVQNSGTGKWIMWGSVVVGAPDQLRQRVAWGLSQILVVGPDNGETFYPDWTESWAAYYDIFLAHAFGNYRDIMREVSLSPFMGRYLSMKGNLAFAHSGKHPDENFARELMQLFSIGLWQLHPDGTPKIDPSTNQYINTYSNDDIMAFARVWTGWDLQPNRGSIMAFDDYDHPITNNLDPMLLNPKLRDRFPKTTLLGKGHLGDGYPLCSQLGPQHYLKQGARYEYHGSDSMFGDVHDNAQQLPNIRSHHVPDAVNSQLYQALCGMVEGNCTFPPIITLDADLACHGAAECNADVLRVVKIVDGDAWGFYTFVDPPCVRLQFFDDGRTAMNHMQAVCADPTAASNVGAQCCGTVDDQAVCPGEVDEYGREQVFQYVAQTGNPDRGDYCVTRAGGLKCPVGCKKTSPGGAPHCILSSDATNSVPCHLDVGGAIASSGGECLYVAEPMKYATAAARCAAEYANVYRCKPWGAGLLNPGYDEWCQVSCLSGESWHPQCQRVGIDTPDVNTYCSCSRGGQVCDQNKATFGSSTIDGQSLDWQVACSGFMLSWTNDPCTLQVQVFPLGQVAVVDRKNTIDLVQVDAANKFKVQWGLPPPGHDEAYPKYAQNCTSGCRPSPSHGGTCLCDLTVETAPVILADPEAELPTTAKLRAGLVIGAVDPAAFAGEYTLCTTNQCNSNPDVRVHTRGASEAPAEFGVDTIFEFVETASTRRPSARRPSRFLLNKASVVHVGSTVEFKMLQPTMGIEATCTGASSEGGDSSLCGRAVDDSKSTGWATQQEQVGAWMSMAFDNGVHTVDRMVYSNLCGEFKQNKVVQLEFSDGTTQMVNVSNHCDAEVVELDAPVTTSTVKLTVVEAYSTDPNANSGARMIRFLAVGNDFVSTASVTPCEDSGLLPLTETECEVAAGSVQLPPGEVVGRGGSNTVGLFGSMPQKCSMWDTDYSPHWNERHAVLNWDTHYWPLCKVAAETSQSSGGHSSRTGFHFRNPPHFVGNTGEQAHMQGGYGATKNPYGDGDHLQAAAQHETEALLSHLFEHPNTAPFVAYRMIQRLIGSNPTPRYVEAVATAFKTGTYGGHVYSGEYGDMAAMTAAIMLDREARSTVLDADATSGQMREPVLKVIHLLRSMEYTSKGGMDINLDQLGGKIGQFAFSSPTVFNFYLPEFSPAGPVQEAGLVAPEAQIATGPNLIGYLNGVSSLIDEGLTSCNRGFGSTVSQAAEGDRMCHLDPGVQERIAASDGVLSFSLKHPTHPDKAVDELALLLTGGRLGMQTRHVLVDVYTSHLDKQHFDMGAGVAEAIAALDSFMIPEEDCSYAVKAALGIPIPVAATCEASSEWMGCENALDSTFGETPWRTQANFEGPPSGRLSSTAAQCIADVREALGGSVPGGQQTILQGSWHFVPPGCSYKLEDNRTYYNNHETGRPESTSFAAVASDPADYNGAWIKVAFDAGETLIDRMAYANVGDSQANAEVLLEFSDGSSQLVSGLPESHLRTVFPLNPVTTSFVKISIQSVHNTAPENNGARSIHFYGPGGADFGLQGRMDLESGSWADLPKGCSYQSDQGGDNAAYWNLHNAGCGGPNCGGHTSVLAAGSVDGTFMPQQSSTVGAAGPYEAIDGKTGYEWNHIGSMSCVESELETSPWYQLDLGSAQEITTIVYHARRCDGDCNAWTHGMSVYVDNLLIASDVNPGVGEVISFDFYQTGRVIRIENAGAQKKVSFCELEVNLARNPDADGYYASRPVAEAKALKHTMKLLAISPDFHATNFHNAKTEAREQPPEQTSQGRDYKAVVVVYLAGGADSFNIVVPHGGDAEHPDGSFKSDCRAPGLVEHDLYAEYASERGSREALGKSQLLAVNVSGSDQPCETFGLHPSAPNLQRLYNDGDATLVANMGSLIEPITLQEWNDGSTVGARQLDAGSKALPPGLFGHNIMQKNAWTVHAENRDAEGVLGRMVAKLTDRPDPLKSAMYSINGYQRMLTGAPFPPTIIDAGEGLSRFEDYASLAEDIAKMTSNASESLLAETYAAVLESSIQATESFGRALEGTVLESGNDFVSTGVKKNRFASQLKEVAKVIQLDNAELEMELSVFYTQMGHWDTHGSMDISAQLGYIDEAVGMLADELKTQGLWDNVTIVCLSDFGRTLNSNSRGTDHGWGGNYWVAGGNVKGKQMLGQFPPRLTEFESDVNVGRGRFIPTTPWESVWNAVGEWLELGPDELHDVLPHKRNFPPGSIFRKDQLFET